MFSDASRVTQSFLEPDNMSTRPMPDKEKTHTKYPYDLPLIFKEKETWYMQSSNKDTRSKKK